jgi:glycine oxidase
VKVTIVGAGIIGYAVAYELASRGAEVRLVDPRGLGQGATRASGGILAPHIEGHAPDLLRLGLCSLDHYDRFIGRVAADAQTAIEYRRSGTLQVARTDAEARELDDLARALAERGAPCTRVDGSGARRLEPALADDIRAGLLVPAHGYVGVATLMAALAAASRRRGARLDLSPVDRIESAGGVRVHAGHERIESDAVVVAAGSWSGGIPMAPAVAAAPVRPVRGQIVLLRFEAPPLTRVVWGTASGSAAYLVPWTDGTLLVGATSEDVGFDDRVTPEAVTHLRDMASQLLPASRTARFIEARAGLRPATPDELPIVGRSSTMRGVYYATGHYRNGVLLAPLTAALVADLVLDGRERAELALMRPDRFGL